MSCSSGKRTYHTKEDAWEALIGARINFQYADASGPVNFYLCLDCAKYHLTSSGPPHDLLQSAEVQNRIRLEREARHWENKTK